MLASACWVHTPRTDGWPHPRAVGRISRRCPRERLNRSAQLGPEPRLQAEQRALVAFLVLVLAGVRCRRVTRGPFPDLAHRADLLMASWIPNIVGILVTARADGRAGLTDSSPGSCAGVSVGLRLVQHRADARDAASAQTLSERASCKVARGLLPRPTPPRASRRRSSPTSGWLRMSRVVA
jgi:hypothetical protein